MAILFDASLFGHYVTAESYDEYVSGVLEEIKSSGPTAIVCLTDSDGDHVYMKFWDIIDVYEGEYDPDRNPDNDPDGESQPELDVKLLAVGLEE